MLNISYVSCCLLKNLDLGKMYQCPIYLGTARNARKRIQKPAPVAFLSYQGWSTGGQSMGWVMERGYRRKLVCYQANISISQGEWWEFSGRGKHFSLLWKIKPKHFSSPSTPVACLGVPSSCALPGDVRSPKASLCSHSCSVRAWKTIPIISDQVIIYFGIVSSQSSLLELFQVVQITSFL